MATWLLRRFYFLLMEYANAQAEGHGEKKKVAGAYIQNQSMYHSGISTVQSISPLIL